MRILDSELRKLPQAEREKKWRELLASTNIDPKHTLVDIEEEILKYESVFKMTTEAMIQRLENGSLEETNEICRWTMLADLRTRLRAYAARREKFVGRPISEEEVGHELGPRDTRKTAGERMELRNKGREFDIDVRLSDTASATVVCAPNTQAQVVLVYVKGSSACGFSRFDLGKRAFIDAVDGIDLHGIEKEAKQNLAKEIVMRVSKGYGGG